MTKLERPTSFCAPPPLRPGDTIAIVAPASPFPDAQFLPGLAWLHQRYRLRMRDDIRARRGYLAGDDERRAGELTRAMRDPDVRAIFCARGGYGIMRIVERLPWDAFAASPRWLVGFSDVTALHVEATARGIMSVHGPNVTGLGTHVSPLVRHELCTLLSCDAAPRAFTGLLRLHDGAAEGPAAGGNLALLAAMAGAGRLVLPRGAVLFVEDVTERPYRIDRMLTTLRLGGHLADVAAIVFGELVSCEPGADGVTAEEVLRECTSGLGIPVLARAPFGHGAVNRPLLMGERAIVSADSVTLLGASGAGLS